MTGLPVLAAAWLCVGLWRFDTATVGLVFAAFAVAAALLTRNDPAFLRLGRWDAGRTALLVPAALLVAGLEIRRGFLQPLA